jgi:hypothetical protein
MKCTDDPPFLLWIFLSPSIKPRLTRACFNVLIDAREYRSVTFASEHLVILVLGSFLQGNRQLEK